LNPPEETLKQTKPTLKGRDIKIESCRVDIILRKAGIKNICV
jgi:hypothetical protein